MVNRAPNTITLPYEGNQTLSCSPLDYHSGEYGEPSRELRGRSELHVFKKARCIRIGLHLRRIFATRNDT